MTAGEFAFLAIGLVLGAGVGSATVQVLRARAPSRHVRVTVAPNSIPSRRSSTLAETAPADSGGGPARGGPADRRWVDRELPDEARPEAPSPPPAPLTVASPDADGGATSSTSVLSPSGIERVDLGRAPVTAPTSTAAASVGIPISMEPDPGFASLRAAAPQREAVEAMVMAGDGASPARPEASRGRVDRDERPANVAVAGVASTGPGTTAAVPAASSAGPPPVAVSTSPRPVAAALDPEPAASHDPTDACAEARRIADERCAVSTRARDGAREAVEALRTAQRTYDDHVTKAEEAAAAADPRAVRTAKETAQQAFRQARAAATTRDAIEAAARDWLTEINRINHDTRDSVGRADRHRAAATELAPALERLAVEADAARISAEAAEEACVAAREAVATCQEGAALEAQGLKTAPATTFQVDDELEPTATPMASRAGEDAAIIRLLRGDREVLTRIVATLGGDDEAERRRWQLSISNLLEALVARSIEASAFDFPIDHPFWGMFNRAQSRDIAAALSSLGYRHDGFGGWAEDHVPSQRDLSLATGYAGLDPMRIRHWPGEQEMQDLLREVTVAADEYVWEAAGALTLGELISLLGRRADALTELWNDWGAVRPLLLAGD